MMKKHIVLITLLIFSGINGYSQDPLLTVAERSGFTSTANYEDVMTFVKHLDASPFVRVEHIAVSTEGRIVPLLVIGNPLPAGPEDLKNDRRIVIYVQANIHADEVEGKEAVLMFARDLLAGKHPGLLDNIVFLICPNLNPDGNEPISKLHRTYQNGPVNGVGIRYNAQMLDLNRDAMKLESPEVKGVVTNVFNRWDPQVFMDCHTTNGSYHVEPVTFTWMVNPNGDNSLIKYMRDKMAPAMSESLLKKYGVENCFYGEFNDMGNPETGWFYDASVPRYMTEYFGLRNRLAILNENYVYADYESRVKGCYWLIRSLADHVSANKDEIRDMIRQTDARTVSRGLNPAPTDSFAIEFDVRPAPEKVTIKTYEAKLVGETDGWKRYEKTDVQLTVTVPYYIDYFSTRQVSFPFAYLLKTSDPDVLDLLTLHGIKVEVLEEDSEFQVERFVISELKGAQRLNQGHYTNTIKGKFVTELVSFKAGTYVVRTSQPLANLAAYLLEPLSNDGLVTWNFFDKYLVPQWGRGYNEFPVYKLIEKTGLKTRKRK